YDADYLQLDGNTGNISTFDGSYVLVDIMFTRCAPCVLSMVYLKEVNQVANKTFPLISISVDPDYDTPEILTDFKDEYNASWEFGIDHEFEFTTQFEADLAPTLILLDKQGTELKRWIGVTSSCEIIGELNKYEEIPNHYCSDIEGEDFIHQLINSRIFVVFLIVLWLMTIYLVIRLIQMRSQIN
ncbi:MAG: TlpA family protein disulfide reductase, partial [Candidatus Kariarchaeaceae archaeon]